MENIKWNKSIKKTSVFDLLSINEYYVPLSILEEKVDVIELIKNIDKTVNLPFAIQEFDDTTSTENETKYCIVNHATEFCVLKLIYNLVCDWGKYKGFGMKCINCIEQSKGLLDISKVVSAEDIKKCDEWAKQLEAVIVNACEINTLDEFTNRSCEKLGISKKDLTLFFKNTIIDVEWSTAEYVGPKLSLEFNGSMTINEFQQKFVEVFHAIPVLLDKENKPHSKQVKLEELGISGENVFAIPPHCTVLRINTSFNRQFKVGMILMYVARPWAHITGDVTLTSIEVLPPVLKSIFWAIAWKLL